MKGYTMKGPKMPSPDTTDNTPVPREKYDQYVTASARTRGILILLMIGLTIVLAVTGWAYLEEADLIKKRSKALTASADRIEIMSKELEVLRSQKKAYEEAAAQDVEDLVAYIQTRYRKVPIEVATLIANALQEIATEMNMDFNTAVGIMEVESAFNPMAISDMDARGLMQVLPRVWQEPLGVKHKTDFHDVRLNIQSGIHVYLHYLNKENGNTTRALNRYNGSDAVKGKYAALVYEKIGRFIAFRNNTFEGNTDEEQEEEILTTDAP